MSRRAQLLLIPLLGLLPFAGCGSSEPAAFRVREDVGKLMKGTKSGGKARAKVEETIERFYGSPSELRVWERLPIDFGGYRGRVVVPEEPDYNTKSAVTIAWDAGDVGEEAPTIAAGTRAIYRPLAPAAAPAESEEETTTEEGNEVVSEPVAAPEPVEMTVAGYDHEKGLLVFEQAFPSPPAAGAEILVDPGAKLVYGKHLYLEHCMHCHGVTGDGNGPTARYLNPRPRDYRNGVFKFTSTGTPYKAHRHDLALVVRNGIPGTYMPSFLLLEDDEMDAIVEYVRWLACRGEQEKFLADNLLGSFSQEAYDAADKEGKQALVEEFEAYLASDDEFDSWTAIFKESVDDQLVKKWNDAQAEAAVIVPDVPRVESTPESVARGRALYVGGKAKCVNCHGPGGKGDGQQTRDFQLVKGTTKTHPEPGLYDDWGNQIQPRNLTLGLYRGGRRPIDVFRRIKAGIKGTPMPAAAISDAEIWDLVNYVMSLPYETPAASAPNDAAATAAKPTAAGDTES